MANKLKKNWITMKIYKENFIETFKTIEKLLIEKQCFIPFGNRNQISFWILKFSKQIYRAIEPVIGMVVFFVVLLWIFWIILVMVESKKNSFFMKLILMEYKQEFQSCKSDLYNINFFYTVKSYHAKIHWNKLQDININQCNS